MIKSPRILRPDTVIVKNLIGEVDFIATYLETELKYVRMDTSYGIRQSNKGIDSDNSAVLVIDLNDLVASQKDAEAKYVDCDDFEKKQGTFTFAGGDTVIFSGHDYVVNKVNNSKRELTGLPVFLEVFLK